MIHKVLPEAIDFLPKEAIQYLRNASLNACGDLTAEDALICARNSSAEIYLISNPKLCGAMCIMYGNGTQGRILDVVLLGGDRFRSWFDEVRKYVIDLARQRDCQQVMIIGREGWGRIYPELEPVGVVYSLAIA